MQYSTIVGGLVANVALAVLLVSTASAGFWVGVIFLVLTGLFLVTWFLAAVITRANVTAIEGTSVGLDLEVLTGPTFREWESVASSGDFTWESPNCDSTAIYGVHNETEIKVQNVCKDVKTGQVSMATGTAAATDVPGVLAVSFFPGIYGSFVVRQINPDRTLLIVTDAKNLFGWLLRKKGTRPPDTKEFVSRLKQLVGPVVLRHDLRN